MTSTPTIETHDQPPPESLHVVDEGLGAHNDDAAPLHDVQPLAAIARTGPDVVGGAVGRTWGRCAEVQQLWVHPDWRRRGFGTQLLRAFEARALQRGCRIFYLETWSFQAPALYRALGYEVRAEIDGFAPGIAKYLMVREVAAPPVPET